MKSGNQYIYFHKVRETVKRGGVQYILQATLTYASYCINLNLMDWCKYRIYNRILHLHPPKYFKIYNMTHASKIE